VRINKGLVFSIISSIPVFLTAWVLVSFFLNNSNVSYRQTHIGDPDSVAESYAVKIENGKSAGVVSTTPQEKTAGEMVLSLRQWVESESPLWGKEFKSFTLALTRKNVDGSMHWADIYIIGESGYVRLSCRSSDGNSVESWHREYYIPAEKRSLMEYVNLSELFLFATSVPEERGLNSLLDCSGTGIGYTDGVSTLSMAAIKWRIPYLSR